MTSQGRGSAVLLVVLIVVVNLQWRSVEGHVYTVGGTQGWGFHSYKKFSAVKYRAGDSLVFIYPQFEHKVVQVWSKEDYDKCVVSKGAKSYTSGRDKIVLKRGWNYFICPCKGHCSNGMKLKVKAF
ncbi:hypothetical protein SUGI_0197950 [Cryptomeria japonica]|uniref:basic blue protein-like n=1 Tax=Cryptomeria japonica TaxID=3369 RepID=UPI002408E0DB|nr:basic blue protein-like [Cryptomeria japonica]GLJ12794.1 hypothetical protein SUGI_0197950 [Cryptomeria japonica]